MTRVSAGLHQFLRFILPLSILATAAVGQASPPLDPDPDLPGATGELQTLGWKAWVIPMDNHRQTRNGTNGPVFNLRAYGLVNQLLWHNIPVLWAIRPDKTKELDSATLEPVDEPDFQAKVFQVKPAVGPAEVAEFFSGPFIIPIKFTKQAEPIIDAFNQTGPAVNVYEVLETTTVSVRYELTHKPRVAVLNPNPSDPIQLVLARAGFIPNDHYRVFDPLVEDSFPPGSCFTMIFAPHTEPDLPGDPGQVTPGMRATVRQFVHNGGNLLAQCLAVAAYENDAQTGTQTSIGIEMSNQTGPVDYENPALAFSQFHGPLNSAETGTLTDWDMPGGIPNDFINSGHIHIRNLKKPFALTATASKFNINQVGSVTFYLGAHNYEGTDDQSRINGIRMLMNAILTPAKPQNCQ